MDTVKKHEQFLQWAELQFIFVQHIKWVDTEDAKINKCAGMTYGKHVLNADEMRLSSDDAALAASVLDHTVTLSLAVWIRQAFQDVLPDARNSEDWNIRSAFEISRLIRNAFSHSPADPTWNIDPICRNKNFVVEDVIQLNTTDIDGSHFDWCDYGGPIALYRLSQWVRQYILAAPLPPIVSSSSDKV